MKPDTPAVGEVRVGQVVLFRYRGEFVLGRLTGASVPGRAAVQRCNGGEVSRRVYWRNMTQLYEPRATA